jgi:hypothetical protein
MKPRAGLLPFEAPLAASPPPEVLDEVSRAVARAKQLAGADRQLHFDLDPRTGRVVVELRTLDGSYIGSLSGADALAALTEPTR